MQLISRVKVSQVIPILLADGTTDTVTLQARSKIHLPKGAVIDPRREKEFQPSVTIAGKTATTVSAPTETNVSGNVAVVTAQPTK